MVGHVAMVVDLVFGKEAIATNNVLAKVGGKHELTFQRANVAALSAVGFHHASTQDFVALVQKMSEVQLQEGVVPKLLMRSLTDPILFRPEIRSMSIVRFRQPSLLSSEASGWLSALGRISMVSLDR